ncbi:MAG: FHA domain-containing protein [Prevotellaceae bacterium]|jgi:hypothetical protein|nr:FHA domain-containing protein [Prevotellaceae bacterium]
MKKFIFSILVLILSSLVILAAEPLSVHLENYQVKNNTLSVYFNTNFSGNISADNLAVFLSGQKLVVKNIKNIESSNDGVTYLFIADNSGSIGEKKLTAMKSMLNNMVLKMKAQDNASFMTLGNDLLAAPFVSDQSAMQNQINALQASNEDTNLYAGIIKALNILSTDSSVKPKKCVVILSDGEDYYLTGSTREEADLKVRQSHLPLYTIAMLDENATPPIIESSKILGSFARLSAGGFDTTHGLDATPYNDITSKIISAVNQSRVLTADIADLKLTNDRSLLEIKLDISGQGTADDGYFVNSYVIKQNITPSALGAAQISLPLISAIILGIVGLIAIFVMFKIKNKKHNNVLPPDMARGKIENDPTVVLKKQPLPGSSQPPPAQSLQPPQLKISFTKLGRGEDKSYSFSIVNELIIGSNPKKAQFTVVDDALLSARHCRIYYQNKKLYLEDLESTNGTFLNRIPIKQPHLLEQYDIISLGATELRVSWETLEGKY